MRLKLNEYKMNIGCQQCDFEPLIPAQLHLDHRDPSTKSNSNSRAVEVSWSWGKIQEELKKCDVLCANCHTYKTFINMDYLA